METENLNVAKFEFTKRVINSIPDFGLTPKEAVEALTALSATLIANCADSRESMRLGIETFVVNNIRTIENKVYDVVALERRKNEKSHE